MKFIMKNVNILSYRIIPISTLIACLLFFSAREVQAQYFSVEHKANFTKIMLSDPNGMNRIVPVSGPVAVTNNIHPFAGPPSVNNIDGITWVLKFTAAGFVFKDVSFANPQVGYIVTELGAVYKTTNGGDNWTQKMNLGFPYYWYGVNARTPDTVIISGFNDQGDIHTGVARWSYDGGNTWTGDIILRIPSGVGWCTRVHFFDQNTGFVSAEFSGGMHYTTNGGRDSTSWGYVQVNSDLGWFAGDVDAQPGGNVYTTGIHFAHSTNYGIAWTSGPPADNVFDGGVDFLDNNQLKGWTGGGQISAPVSGWVHRTTDGAQTWSARLFAFDLPVRSVKFLNDSIGLAVGGNVYSEAGWIYSTTNAGTNWNQDVSTGAEMFSLDLKRISPNSINIWCVGSTGSSTGFTGKLYKTTESNPVGIVSSGNEVPVQFKLYQNYPNPFNPETRIRFDVPSGSNGGDSKVKIVIYNMIGQEIAVLINQSMKAGSYEINWNASSYPSGVYFYKLTAGDGTSSFTDTKKLILIK
jgi:photosystem II stability/assembly factor-like uncharacterized protein